MTIYLYDGSTATCEKLEIGFDRVGCLTETTLILDEYRVIPAEDVVEIRG